jgi:hypothetical protein
VKKYIGLLLLALVLMSLAIPFMAMADAAAPEPDTPTVDVVDPPAIPDLQPAVVYTTGADPPKVDLTPLLQAVLSLCASLITMFLIPWIRSKYTAEQRQRIAAVYQTLVYAAEKMYGAGEGAKKFQWVVDQLEAKGLSVDRATIEAEVQKLSGLGYAIIEGSTARAPDN